MYITITIGREEGDDSTKISRCQSLWSLLLQAQGVHGVVRVVSGAASHSLRDNFREASPRVDPEASVNDTPGPGPAERRRHREPIDYPAGFFDGAPRESDGTTEQEYNVQDDYQD